MNQVATLFHHYVYLKAKQSKFSNHLCNTPGAQSNGAAARALLTCFQQTTNKKEVGSSISNSTSGIKKPASTSKPTAKLVLQNKPTHPPPTNNKHTQWVNKK
jgi:hypothetical protein